MSHSVLELVGLGVGSIRLRKSLVTEENVRYLFGLEETTPLIFSNSKGDEMNISDLSEGCSYHVLTPEDLQDDCPFTMDPNLITQEIRNKTAERITKRLNKMLIARINFVKQHYKPKKPELYHLEREFLDPKFLYHFDQGVNQAIQFMTKETKTGLFSFPFFTDAFCDDMIEEIEKFVCLSFCLFLCFFH